jgi:Transposase DDE domain group 1
VTNLTRPAERVIAFYNQRGAVEQWIKEGKGAIKWTPLSARTFAANTVRLQPPPLMRCAYTLGNFMRTLAMPEGAQPWSLTSRRKKVIKIGAKVVSHGRYVTFQMAEVAVPRQIFADILALIAGRECRRASMVKGENAAGCHGRGMLWCIQSRAFRFRQLLVSTVSCQCWTRFALAQAVQRRDPGLETGGNPANVGSE